jgi:hypothetical protein
MPASFESKNMNLWGHVFWTSQNMSYLRVSIIKLIPVPKEDAIPWSDVQQRFLLNSTGNEARWATTFKLGGGGGGGVFMGPEKLWINKWRETTQSLAGNQINLLSSDTTACCVHKPHSIRGCQAVNKVTASKTMVYLYNAVINTSFTCLMFTWNFIVYWHTLLYWWTSTL